PDLADRSRELLRRGRHRLHVHRRLLRRLVDRIRETPGLLRRLGHRRRRRLHLGRRRGDAVDHGADRCLEGLGERLHRVAPLPFPIGPQLLLFGPFALFLAAAFGFGLAHPPLELAELALGLLPSRFGQFLLFLLLLGLATSCRFGLFL